jgi:hypothetical protein
LAGCGFGWRCQQNSDYQPVDLRFASLPALSSLSQKRNLISLPVLSVCHQQKLSKYEKSGQLTPFCISPSILIRRLPGKWSWSREKTTKKGQNRDKTVTKR